MYDIKIQQWPIVTKTNKKGSILDTALKAGIPFPHSCRSGECGKCKTKILCGKVNHDHYMEEALSDTERQQGFVLACRARPSSDIEIAWNEDVSVEISIPVKKYKAKVSSIEQMAHNVTRVRVNTGIAFAAGQYASLGFAKLPVRSFSMANRPDEQSLEFHIRHVPNGVVSNYVAHQLKVGDKVSLEGPYGTSYFREQHQGPVIAAAGGTGLAPMLSVIRQALQLQPNRSIHLYFGVQDEKDIYAEEQLQTLASHYTNLDIQIVLSAAKSDTPRRTGFLHQAIADDFKALTGAMVYAAGPPPMIDALSEVVRNAGVRDEDILTDPFTTSGESKTVEVPRRSFGGFSRLFGRLAATT